MQYVKPHTHLRDSDDHDDRKLTEYADFHILTISSSRIIIENSQMQLFNMLFFLEQCVYLVK